MINSILKFRANFGPINHWPYCCEWFMLHFV